ncbi:MAG: hypothetical protein ACI8TX_002525 [Hyphomicrobiaceae bacterium]|jgi:hypothetical protein
MKLSEQDHIDLVYAVELLENPGLAARLVSMLGTPIESGMSMLPAGAHALIERATTRALGSALEVALSTLDRQRQGSSRDRFHKALVIGSGFGAGAFGLPALAVELPVTTTVMLRSIADIARSEGESLEVVSSRLACLEVLAFGGRGSDDDSSDSGYFMVRTALARAISDAAAHVAKRGIVLEGAPALVRLVAQIASRFGVVASEKVAVQAVPVVGALGGAFVNSVFIDHFQDMARGHFIVRRLERTHGPDAIRTAYDAARSR